MQHRQRTGRRQGKRLVVVTAFLAAVAAVLGDPASAGTSGAVAATAWNIFGPTSEVGLVGSTSLFDDQDVDIAAAVSPADWRTLESVVFPRIDFALGEWLDLAQSGEATGTFDPATGILTLDLTLAVEDNTGASATIQVELTTEQTNGIDPDGNPACLGDLSDPSVCEGTRWDPSTGTFRLVAIEAIPQGAGTGLDRELLFLELDGRIVPADGDGDGLQSFVDNCPTTPNPDQADIDADAIGDACDLCTDKDHDGYGSPGHATCSRGAAADCNDTDATIHPAAPEYCDGQDDDCDLAADEATCSEFDVDGDGFVDGVELSWIGRAFGLCSPTPAAEWWFAIDVDPDGCIDGDDLAYLTTAWSCTPALPICP